MTEKMTEKTNNSRRQTLVGTVVKHSGDKTISVLVERYVKHPKYQKFQTRSKRYAVHNEDNSVEIGDRVVIEEARPLSKTKRYRVIANQTKK